VKTSPYRGEVGLFSGQVPPQPAGRKPVVADDGETTDDLVGDMVELLTSFCARLDGRRGARNRALRALTAAAQGA
jgi:predicted site-specific integrase-resolvase